MAVYVKKTQQNSPADMHNLQNTTLLAIDGKNINDVFDYQFYSQSAKIKVKYEKNGEIFDEIIEKQEYTPLGCEFDTYLMDKKHSCKNKCIFCFIDQLPKGLRPHLYFKDDDERLSFLFGNYITLTNLTQKEIQRIIKMRISPINISVHTVDENLRVKIMNNKRAGDVLRYIKILHEAKIEMNFQLVLCPNINDGEQLIKSLEYLSEMFPYTKSVAAVPVGLTKFRQNLPALEIYNNKTARDVIDIIELIGEKNLKKYGKRLVFAADEFYLIAKKHIPNLAFYEDLPQLENGVGMWRLLHNEFTGALFKAKAPLFAKKYNVITAQITYPLIKKLCAAVSFKFPHIKIKVHKIKNNFFGGNVNVTGLLTGRDIIEQCKGKLIGKILFLPENMLREEQDMFLDNTTIIQMEKELNIKTCVLPMSGKKALEIILDT